MTHAITWHPAPQGAYALPNTTAALHLVMHEGRDSGEVVERAIVANGGLVPDDRPLALILHGYRQRWHGSIDNPNALPPDYQRHKDGSIERVTTEAQLFETGVLPDRGWGEYLMDMVDRVEAAHGRRVDVVLFDWEVALWHCFEGRGWGDVLDRFEVPGSWLEQWARDHGYQRELLSKPDGYRPSWWKHKEALMIIHAATRIVMRNTMRRDVAWLLRRDPEDVPVITNYWDADWVRPFQDHNDHWYEPKDYSIDNTGAPVLYFSDADSAMDQVKELDALRESSAITPWITPMDLSMTGQILEAESVQMIYERILAFDVPYLPVFNAGDLNQADAMEKTDQYAATLRTGEGSKG